MVLVIFIIGFTIFVIRLFIFHIIASSFESICFKLWIKILHLPISISGFFGCNYNSWQVFQSLSYAGNNPLIHNFFKEKIVKSKHFKSFWELDKQMSGNRLKIPLLYQQKMLIKHCFRGKSPPVQPPQKGKYDSRENDKDRNE